MAILEITNNTSSPVPIPFIGGTLRAYGKTTARVDDVDEVFNDEEMVRLTQSTPPILTVTVLRDETPPAMPVLPPYTDTTRPAASSVPVGSAIFNTGDNFPNYSDGTNWRDPTGAIT